jgi:hypothetical protein
MTLAPFSALQAAIQKTPIGGVVKIPPAQYAVDSSLVLPQGNTYDFTGSSLVATHAGTMIRLGGPKITMISGIYDSVWPRIKPKGQNPSLNILVVAVDQSDFTWIRPEVRNVDNGLQLWPGQTDTWIIEPHATPDIRGDMFYLGGGDETVPRGRFVCQGGLLEDSEQEHGLRASTVGFSYGLFSGTTFRNTNNKEPAAMRHLHDTQFQDCIFDGNLFYIGNTGGEPTGQECYNLTFNNCKWQCTGYTQGNSCYLQLNGNAHDIIVNGGSIDIRDDIVAPGGENVAILLNDTVHNITIQNLTRYITRSTKPWYRNWTKSQSDQVANFQFDQKSNQTIKLKDFQTRQVVS